MTKNVLEFENVGFTYTIRHGGARNLKDVALNTFGKSNIDVKVAALTGINFTITEGDVLGVIGRNGSGKSTLLKLMARVLPPTKGVVRMRGSIAPMIELGAGFNPELTGAENIVLFGVLMGNSAKLMKSKISEITQWAGIEDQIELPLRTYSTGMIARLGFAVATFRQSELLIIDEVLSVGDADFQLKSLEKIKELISLGEGTILASHDLNLVAEQATKVLWLDHGRQAMFGNSRDVIDAYRKS